MTNEEIAVLIQQGNSALYAELWAQNIGIFTQKAYSEYSRREKVFKTCGAELDDVLQCCFLALTGAVKAFKADGEYKLLTYFNYQLQSQISELLGIRTTKRDPLNRSKSLDEPIDEQGEATPADLILDVNAQNSFEEVERAILNRELRAALETALNSLTAPESDVIRRKYYHTQTVENIADDMQLNVDDVRRLYTKAMRQLKRPQFYKPLKPYAAELLERYAYRGTGLSAFRNSGASCVERAVIKIDESGAEW